MSESEDRAAVSVAAVARLQARLAETEEQLAATSEILAVLGASGSGEAEVFDAIVERARRLCWATRRRSTSPTQPTSHGPLGGATAGLPEPAATRKPVPRDRTSLVGRVGLDGRTQQIVDVLADPDYDRPEFQR